MTFERHVVTYILVPIVALVGALGYARTAAAQVRGISYTLAPTAERIYFDKNSGLEDGTFYGGRIGFGFGEYAELSGIYRVSSGLSTDFMDFADLGTELQDRFEVLPPRDVSARMYGAELKFNLGRGSIFPLLALGTGILEFDPDNLEESRHIYLSGAAGLQLAFGENFSLLAQVEDLIYRYSPPRSLLSNNDLADLGLNATDFGNLNVHNLAVRVALQMYVGGRARGELSDVDLALRQQLSGGLSGIRLQIEPMGGMIVFSEDLGYREHQRMAGVHAGLDLGPYLGVRGFYWRGVEEDSYSDFDDLHSYGGELRLQFGSIATSFIPHLMLGGGYLDVLDGYEGSGLVQAVDRPFGMGGVGLDVPLAGGIQLNAAVRSLLISMDDAQDVTGPSQLTSSWLYSAGFRFGLGGRDGDLQRPEPRRVVVDGRLVPAGVETELERLRLEVDSLQAALRRSQITGELPPGAAPTETARREIRAGSEWVTIPVPEEGEFYVRYGGSGEASRLGAGAPEVVYIDPETGGVLQREALGDVVQDESLSAADIRQIVRDAMQRELESRREQEPGADLAVPYESETVRRLSARIEELEARLDARTRTSEPTRTRPAGDRSVVRDRAGYELQSIVPFVGFGLSQQQVGVAGLRMDVLSRSVAGLRFVPELVASAGEGGVSYGLNVGTVFPFGIEVGSLQPYAGLGLGLTTIDGAELVFNLMAGVEQTAFRGRFFAEYMSQDFFDLNRFVVGYRLSI